MVSSSSCKVVHLDSLPPFDLASLTPEQKRNMMGELLYPLVEKLEPRFAPKITGMILELDKDRVFHLIESPEELKEAVKEAIKVLKEWIPQLQQQDPEAASKLLASMQPSKL